LPVVVSDIGGISEGMSPGQSGVVFQAGNPEALRAALRTILDRSDEWAAMSIAGRALVEDRYLIAPLNTALLGIYEQVLAGD
jgi:glycosyltransferase involved in cell wall biosynthesis